MSTVVKFPWIKGNEAMTQMELQNKLQFVVDIDADKPAIQDAIEQQYDVSVVKVNTQVTTNGRKRAIVTLSAEDDAEDVASRIGVF